MKNICTRSLLLATVLFIGGFVQAQNKTPFFSGHAVTIKSAILGEDRKIQIYVPANLRKDEACPVLYLLDGEVQGRMVAGQIEYLSEFYKIIPSMILVAIENTDRVRDLTPTHSTVGPDGKVDTSRNAFGRNSGGGEKFLQFIQKELMPYVREHYAPASYNILSGHSLGGLLAIHSFIHHPDYFDAYIAISPSLQWDNGLLLKQAAEKIGKVKKGSRLFFSDANENEAFHRNQLILDSLVQTAKPVFLSKYVHYPEESHTSEPVKAFYDGIRFIYPDWHLPYGNAAFRKQLSAKIIKGHYEKLSTSYGYTVIPTHDDINMISRFLRNDSSRIADAIELLEMNAVNFPKSALVFELLGETYGKTGNREKAILNFERSLQLQPENDKLREKMKSFQNK